MNSGCVVHRTPVSDEKASCISRTHRTGWRRRRNGDKGHGGTIVPVDFGRVASMDGLRWSCRAAHRGTGRRRRRSLAGLARVWGTFGCWWVRVAGRLPPPPPSGREWNGAQSGQGATELLTPEPTLGQMESEATCRAGEPSGDREGPPPEGLGGYQLLAQTDARRPAG